MYWRCLCPALTCLVLAALGAEARGGHLLAENGATDWAIAVDSDATRPDRTAARELQIHLEAVTGAQFPILETSPGDAAVPNRFYVGSGRRFRSSVPRIRRLGEDGIRIYSKGDSLYLGGQGPRGALYAVYTFLEDEVGCRWWTPTESEIPERPRLLIPAQDVAFTPLIRVREAFYHHAFDPVFAARNRLNGHFQEIPEAYGGHHRILGWCHTFFPILPPEENFAEHPEWYSLVNGQRIDNGQLCLTNQEMRAEFIRNTLEWIRADSEAGIISISQNDWRRPCECPECAAVVEKNGSQAGPLIDFVNSVAEAVEQEFPDFLVMTLAYSYTRKAPSDVRPRGNVVVRLCSIECDFSEPLATGARNAGFLQDIEEWRRIAPQLYIWNYVTNFSHFLMPHPNWDGLAPDTNLFVKHGAVGVFQQGDRRSTCGDFHALRPWLLAKLLWDPGRDTDALIQEFLDGYYGPAGEHLAEYIAITRQAVADADVHLGCFRRSTADWLGLDDLNRITEALDTAAALVAEEPVYARRLATARMPVDYVWLRRYAELARTAREEGKPFRGPRDPVAARDAFLREVEVLDCLEFGEDRLWAHAARGLAALFAPDGPVPEPLKTRDPGNYVYRSAHSLNVAGHTRSAALTRDPLATDGYALRIPAHVPGRSVRCPIDPEMQGLERTECFVRLRVDAREETGPACAVGVYDLRSDRELRRVVVDIGDLDPDGYMSVRIPREGARPERYFFVEALNNPDSIDAVYVEGFYLVGEERTVRRE